MDEHTPHSDAQLGRLEAEGLCRDLVADLREARRLLRAVEWIPDDDEVSCSMCGNIKRYGHDSSCDLGRYLVAGDKHAECTSAESTPKTGHK